MVLETAGPLALSAHLLDRCIVFPFVVPLCFQTLVRPGPIYRLVIPLPRVRIICLFSCAIVPRHPVYCIRFCRRLFALALLLLLEVRLPNVAFPRRRSVPLCTVVVAASPFHLSPLHHLPHASCRLHLSRHH